MHQKANYLAPLKDSGFCFEGARKKHCDLDEKADICRGKCFVIRTAEVNYFNPDIV